MADSILRTKAEWRERAEVAERNVTLMDGINRRLLERAEAAEARLAEVAEFRNEYEAEAARWKATATDLIVRVGAAEARCAALETALDAVLDARGMDEIDAAMDAARALLASPTEKESNG
jgi:chromosome segregation ATPase